VRFPDLPEDLDSLDNFDHSSKWVAPDAAPQLLLA